jgi:transcriptional regulator with XRE-family HTH domain
MARKKVARKTRTNGDEARRDERKPEWSIVTYPELEAWREKQGIPKKRLAHLLGVTNSTWHNWARGKAVATYATQRRIRGVIDGQDPGLLQAASGPLRRPLRVGVAATGVLGGGARPAEAFTAAATIVSSYLQASKTAPDQAGLVRLIRDVLHALE